jgi:hypothetical protein
MVALREFIGDEEEKHERDDEDRPFDHRLPLRVRGESILIQN